MGGWVGVRDSFSCIEKYKMSIAWFLKILIPYSRLSRFDKTDLKDYPTRACFDFSILIFLNFKNSS